MSFSCDILSVRGRTEFLRFIHRRIIYLWVTCVYAYNTYLERNTIASTFYSTSPNPRPDLQEEDTLKSVESRLVANMTTSSYPYTLLLTPYACPIVHDGLTWHVTHPYRGNLGHESIVENNSFVFLARTSKFRSFVEVTLRFRRLRKFAYTRFHATGLDSWWSMANLGRLTRPEVAVVRVRWDRLTRRFSSSLLHSVIRTRRWERRFL